VLELLRKGLSNREVADRLGISRAGAAYHVSEILSKLGVRSRREAALLAPEDARRHVWGLAGLAGLMRGISAEAAMKVSASLVVAGGIGVIVLLALGVWLTELRSQGSGSVQFDCLRGEAARNPTGPNGEDRRHQQFFDTVQEAEAFLCVDLPEVHQTNGWRVREVNAIRSNSLDAFDEGSYVGNARAYKYAEIYYGHDQLRSNMTFIVYPEDLSMRGGLSPGCAGPPSPAPGLVTQVDITVQGIPTTMQLQEASRSPPRATVCWQDNGLSYFAGVNYQPGFDPIGEVLPLLESVQ
jgi:hypothetical protein